MPHVRLSLEAENDIDLIADYTVATWGTRQASRYLDKLEDTFDLLAKNPSIGRSCETLHAVCIVLKSVVTSCSTWSKGTAF